MTLPQLEYIVALDKYRHYVTAAHHCFVSQPNLTMQIKKLEEELGVKIFNREKKPLEPTEIGEQLISRAKKILRECKQFKEFVNHEKELIEGEFTVGIIPTLAPYLMPLFLPNFIKDNPKVFLKIQEVQTDHIISEIDNGTIDIGILVTPLNESFIKEIPLFYEPFLLYLPQNHRLFEQKLLMAEDLDPSDVLVLNEGHCFRDQALSICKNVKYDSSIGFDYQSGSIQALKSLVKNGVGYTLVPELSVINDADREFTKRFSSPEPVREVSLVVHTNFIKESVIKRLQDSIQNAIPPRLLSGQNIIQLERNN